MRQLKFIFIEVFNQVLENPASGCIECRNQKLLYRDPQRADLPIFLKSFRKACFNLTAAKCISDQVFKFLSS